MIIDRDNRAVGIEILYFQKKAGTLRILATLRQTFRDGGDDSPLI